jgi:LmbE family N-acetylglucosaminyl deacetylase
MRTKKQAEDEGYCGLLNLGIPKTNIINLKFPTKKIPYNNEIIELINKHIDELKPDLIITHHINSESHQDHLNLAKSVMAAARYQKNIWMFEPLYPSKMSNIPFRPIIFVDISKYLDAKIYALKVQTSQWKKYPYWKDLITSVARLRGIEIKTQYAEAFEPIKQEFPLC